MQTWCKVSRQGETKMLYTRLTTRLTVISREYAICWFDIVLCKLRVFHLRLRLRQKKLRLREKNSGSGKKTPAPGKKLRLREKNSGSGRKFKLAVQICQNWKFLQFKVETPSLFFI